MGSLADEYGEQAAYCHQRARTATSPEVAQEWLRMAGAWLAMANFRQQKSASQIPQEDLSPAPHESNGAAGAPKVETMRRSQR